MLQDSPSKKKTDVLQICFLIPPVIVLAKMANLAILKSLGVNEILLAAILGGLGGAFGGLIYNLVKNKNNYIKAIALIGELVIIFSVFIYLVKLSKQMV